jgi:sporulation protein YlmC with PRC-barrel domain
MTTAFSPPRLSTVEAGTTVLAAEDVRNYDVRDLDNKALGRVEDLVIDRDAGRVRFLKVGDGGILGIGRIHRLVPVDIVKGVAGDFVFLDITKETIDGAPRWRPLDDPSSVMEPIRYFGCRPFWSEGYTAPDWTTPD